MIQTGYYSHIELLTSGKSKHIKKTVKTPDPSNLKKFIEIQRQRLEKASIPVSKLVEIELGQEEIIIVEEYAGDDFVDIVDAENLPMYLQKLLEQVYLPLFKNSEIIEDDFVSAGIDPVLRNFVYNVRTGQFVFVDFFPPKIYFEGKFIQEVPELSDPDFLEIRKMGHNSLAGLFYVTYINTVRIYPNSQKIIQAIFLQFLQKNRITLSENYILTSPIYRLTDVSQAKEIIENIETWQFPNYYYLRELANWVLTNNSRFIEKHNEIYKLTGHIRDENSPDYGRISDHNFNKVRQLLLTGIKSS